MASVNKVILGGNLGRGRETRYTTGGGAVTNIRVATTDTWQDKDGEDHSPTEIVADRMQMLGSREGGGASAPEAAERHAAAEPRAAKPGAPKKNVDDLDD